VVTVPESHYCIVLGVGLSEVVGEVIGLAAGVKEKDCIEVVSEFLAEFGCVLALIWVGVVGGQVEEFVLFGLVDLGDAGV
jgi:uncharacterized protein YwlG (UPF0340 family)